MNQLLKQLVDLALAEVGVREEGGNNRGPRIVEYQQATWLPPGPWPWCAAFTCWLIREWLRIPEVANFFSLRNETSIKAWRPQTAGAFDFERWARSRNLRVLNRRATARAGDLVVFDFSHIGIVIKDQLQGTATIETVEGNTNGAGLRDSKSGDGVWRKRRPVSTVRSYIRLIES